MSKSCLIIIDMQNGILKQKNNVFNSDIILDNIEQCIHHALEKNIKVVITQHENRSSLLKYSKEWNLIDSLKQFSDKCFLIEKKHPSIYKNTNLQDVLNKDEIKTVYIGGLVSNGCIKAACLESMKNGYTSYLLEDCHSTFYKNAEKIISEVNTEMNNVGIKLIATHSFVESSI